MSPMKPQKSHPDLVKHYVDLIQEEREKLEECLKAITEYAEQLRRVTADATQRLLTRD